MKDKGYYIFQAMCPEIYYSAICARHLCDRALSDLLIHLHLVGRRLLLLLAKHLVGDLAPEGINLAAH